jgi:acetyl-CoA carboxylase carboxyl transferase subunit alpha
MSTANQRLTFERPIAELEARLREVESKAGNDIAGQDDVRRMRRELAELKKKIYSGLSPWETVQVARHPDRPMTTDYLALLFDEFVELFGDKFFGDDRAIRVGFAKIDQYKVLVVGHQKGKTLRHCRSARPATLAARIPRDIARRSAR